MCESERSYLFNHEVSRNAMKESVVTEHLNLNTIQKLIIFNNTMLLKVSGKCSSFEVKAAHRNQKAQIKPPSYWSYSAQLWASGQLEWYCGNDR